MGTIVVENLGKSYKSYKGRWGRIASWMGLNRGVLSENWVLRGLDFELKAGEAVGIIGQNGAGKSTLLKLITGTTRPTEGTISMVGRVSALLELGMGFHPDLTGRQNAYLSGSLLGLTQAEVTALMPSIEAFAEIGEYIDEPVRLYSSGMQARLAFSVATAVRPDILIVDEVLSVGDAYFQHKSFERIRVYRSLGTTLLIVSHDRMAIQAVCDRAILLSDGKISKIGKPSEVMDYYHAMIAEHKRPTIAQVLDDKGNLKTTSGTGEANIEKISLLNKEGVISETVEVGSELKLLVNVNIHAPIPRLVFGYLIKDRLGLPVYGANTHHLKMPLENLDAESEVEFEVNFHANLGPGSYSITLGLSESDTHLIKNYEWRELAVLFNVTNTTKPMFAGCAWLNSTIKIKV